MNKDQRIRTVRSHVRVWYLGIQTREDEQISLLYDNLLNSGRNKPKQSFKKARVFKKDFAW